jgi:uncharacterized membrane protein YdjX (TVP38/TMEM64 family)
LRTKQIAVISIIAIAFIAWFSFDLGQYLQFEVLQQRIGELREWYAQNPFLAGVIYFAIYVGVTALSVPGAVLVCAAAGFVCQQYGCNAGVPGVAGIVAGLGAGEV